MDNNNLNPSNLHARENFGSEIPKSITATDSSDNDSTQSAREAEQSPDFNYTGGQAESGTTETSSSDSSAPTQAKGKVKSLIKRGGPITTMILTLVFSGGMLVTTMTPAVGINHFMTTIERQFNMQEVFMGSRKTAAMLGKFGSSNAIDGLNNPGSWLKGRSNRFANMSKKSIANLEKNGWTVTTGGETVLGRTKITELSYGNKKFETPKALGENLATDASMSKSLQRAVRGKFANTVDRVAQSVISRTKLGINRLFGISTRTGDVDTPDEGGTSLSEKMNDSIPPNADADVDGALSKVESDINNSPPKDQNAKTEAQSQSKDLRETTKQAKASKAKGLPLKNNPALASAGKMLGRFAGAITVGSSLCAVFDPLYEAIRFIKTDNAIALARFALIFFQGASAIRAGDATEEEISFLGDRLFEVRSADGSNNWGGEGSLTRSAASSIGYSLAAYQQVPDLTKKDGVGVESATQFQNGTPPEVASFYGEVLRINDGFLGTLCGAFNSPTGQTIAVMAGVASAVIGILTGGLSWAVIQTSVRTISASMVRSLTVGLVGNMVKDLISRAMIGSITGLPVSSFTKGEDAGNAIAAGSGTLFGKIAGGTAGGVLTKSGAVSYYKANQVLIAREAEANRAALSPFDISTPDTFMGSIVSSLLPYFSQIQSFRGQLQTIASLASKSFNKLLPSSQALADSTTNMHAMFSQCQDFDYNNGSFKDVAFDIYCNPVYGIPIETLYTQEVALAMGLPMIQTTLVADTGESTASPINYAGELFTPDKVIRYLVDRKYIDEAETGAFAKPNESQPEMLKYRDQCITRGIAPLADSQAVADINDSDKDLGNKIYGKKVGDGSNCILESPSSLGEFITSEGTLDTIKIEQPENIKSKERIDRIMFALFYTDERVQCLIDQGEDCQLDPEVATAGRSTGQIISDGDWPTETTRNLSDSFGCRGPIPSAGIYSWNFHRGIDITAPEGERIVAIQDGVVSQVALDNSLGYYIELTDSGGNRYLYAHLQTDSAVVSVGTPVKKGQELGKTGNTGQSSGPHLHFAVIASDGKYYHPLRYMGSVGETMLASDSSIFKDRGVSEAEAGTICASPTRPGAEALSY